MKRIFCLCIVALMLVGCGNSNVENSVVIETEDNTVEEKDDEKLTEETTEETTEVGDDEGLLTVEITIPKDLAGDKTQDEFDELAKEEGFISATLNADGSVTYKMTRSKQKEILAEMQEQLTDFSKYIGTDDYENITDIKANDDLTEFVVHTKSKELTLNENLLFFNLQISSAIYSAFGGNNAENVKVIYINTDTNEVIEEMNSEDSAQ